jgi:hypothetical protein
MEVKTWIEVEVTVVYDPPEEDSHDCPGSDLKVDSIWWGDEEISAKLNKGQVADCLQDATEDYAEQGEREQAKREDAAEARAEARREREE